MAKVEDKLPGGLGDKKPKSSFSAEALAKGMKVESEHTKDKQIQSEIARDHLTEDPHYYEKLEKMEKKAMFAGFERRLKS